MNEHRRPGFRFQLNAAKPSPASGSSAHNAASAAINGSKKAAAEPFWASWGKQVNDASNNWGRNTQAWWTKSTSKPFKMPKWEMPGVRHS